MIESCSLRLGAATDRLPVGRPGYSFREMASTETTAGTNRRFWQFRLRSLLIVFVVVGFLLVPTRLIIRAWQSLHIETMSVRLTSSGTIPWGDDVLHVSEMHSQLESVVKSFRSHGIKTRLLIECYNDTRESDVKVLRAMAHDAGIEIVDTQYHSWPSPDWSKKQE